MGEEPETAVAMAAAVAAGEVSPSELVDRALARAESWQPLTNAFSQLWPEEAMAAALELQRALEQSSSDPGPLSGVPVAVKDLFDVAGHETTGCSRAYVGRVAARDAEMVRRLREAGAILVGKTNMHELACGGTNLTSACGRTGNPWDPSRMTGGSSGGSGAAVAANVVPIALGTDTGGSIRIPASLCGCWGLKPTTGRLPLDGVLPLSPTLDTPGPMAGRARDLALAWQVMAGASSAPEPVNLGRLSIGVLRGHFSRNADPAVLEMVRQAAVRLEASSASVLPIDGEGIEDALGVWMDLCWSEFAAEHALVGDRVDELLLPETARAFRHGASLGPERREMARARALRIREWFDARMEDVDLLLAPATPYAAPPADEDEIEVEPGVVLKPSEGATSLFTRPVNLSGLPALAFPLGRTSEGLPAGAQLLARRGADELLVGLATTLEAEGFVAELPPLSRDP